MVVSAASSQRVDRRAGRAVVLHLDAGAAAGDGREAGRVDWRSYASAVRPATLRYVSTFLQYAALLLVVAVQWLGSAMPSRKGAAARRKKKATIATPEAAAQEAAEEAAVWDVIVAARLALAQLIRDFRSSVLDGVSALLSTLSGGGVEIPVDPAFPLLRTCGKLLEAVRVRGGSGRADVLELETVVSRTVAGLISGWVASGEEMGKIVLSFQHTLQHIKLP